MNPQAVLVRSLSQNRRPYGDAAKESANRREVARFVRRALGGDAARIERWLAANADAEYAADMARRIIAAAPERTAP